MLKNSACRMDTAHRQPFLGRVYVGWWSSKDHLQVWTTALSTKILQHHPWLAVDAIDIHWLQWVMPCKRPQQQAWQKLNIYRYKKTYTPLGLCFNLDPALDLFFLTRFLTQVSAGTLSYYGLRLWPGKFPGQSCSHITWVCILIRAPEGD